MHTYTVKKDGYDIGQATGKKRAINGILGLIKAYNIEDVTWSRHAGNTICTVKQGEYEQVYSIERC